MQPNYTNDDPRQKMRLYALVGVIVLAVIGIILWLVFRSGSTTLTVSKAVAANMAYARQMDSQTLYYFANSSFVAYDLETYKTTALTPFYSLPKFVTDVQWSEDGALFRATGYSELDQLYPTLVLANLDPNLDYWWLANFETGKLQLVGDTTTGALVRSAAWQDSTHFITAEQKAIEASEQELVRTDLAGTRRAIGTLPEDGIIVKASPATLTYTTQDEVLLHLHTEDLGTQKADERLSDIITVLAVRDDGSAIVLLDNGQDFDPEVPRGKLAVFDAGTNETTILTDDFRGSAFWPQNGKWFAFGHGIDNRTLGYMQAGTGDEVTRFTKAIEVPEDHNTYYQSVGRSGDTLLITNEMDQLLWAGTTLPTDLPDADDFADIQSIARPAFSIAYNSTEEQYNIYILENPYETSRAAAIKFIQQQGYDPNQVKIKWYAYDGVDPGFYLPAGTVSNYELYPTDIDEEAGD